MTRSQSGDLRERVIVVTGATRGIGREIALECARLHATVVVVGRTARGLGRTSLPGSVEDTVDEIVALGATGLGIHADLCDETGTQAIVERTLERFGRCDVLVNNAAYTSNGAMLDVPWKRWERGFRVQVVAPHQLCHGFLPGMRERSNGVILNVSSGASQSLTAGLALYGTSKLAMERWAQFLAAEVSTADGSTAGVAVNTLRVDRLVATEGWRYIAETQGEDMASGGAAGTTPITSESAAAAAVWMIQQPSSFSGQIVGFADIESLGGPAVALHTGSGPLDT